MTAGGPKLKQLGLLESTPTEFYLGNGVFGNQTDNVLVGSEYPDFENEFDALDVIKSLKNVQRADIAYPGRLGEFQTSINLVKINIVGNADNESNNPQFRLKLHVDGSGTPAFDSGLLDAPNTLTEYQIENSIINTQPTGSLKRYHVVIEGHLKATNQSIRCSRPFVRQE